METTVELYPEICCEECNSVIHNHFSCPSCHDEYAGTDIYTEWERNGVTFKCEECETKFTVIDDTKFPYAVIVKWKQSNEAEYEKS